jgi:hypothetical protein
VRGATRLTVRGNEDCAGLACAEPHATAGRTGFVTQQSVAAKIVLLTAEGLGTSGIMRSTGRAKSVVWHWQERFMREGVGGH